MSRRLKPLISTLISQRHETIRKSHGEFISSSRPISFGKFSLSKPISRTATALTGSPTKVKSVTGKQSPLHSQNSESVTSAITNARSRSAAASRQPNDNVGLKRNLSLSEDPQLLTKEEMNDFVLLFPRLVKELVELPDMKDMPDTNTWLQRVLDYNVPNGKRNRGLATALAYRYLADTDSLTQENIQLSYVLGWCAEILQAFFLVADDIMDGSLTRRGLPCWYKVNNLGPAAFNDAILLESAIYKILKKYFQHKDYYVEVLEIFHDATYKTIFGQSLDTRFGLERNIESYTMDRYAGIVKYKTSYYSFSLPVALGMAMARINCPELKSQSQDVTLEMGHLFQVQDDYLDCFGDTELTGKIGTDIQDCKCSWLCVMALQMANPQQRDILISTYGSHNEQDIQTVKNLYHELGLQKIFHTYEEKTYKLISRHIEQMGFGLPKQLFVDMLEKIYRRSS